jgi:hypothetical protein
MKKVFFLALVAFVMTATALSGGCTALDPGETLFLDELYGNSTPTQTPDNTDSGGLDKIPDDVERVDDNKGW